MRRPILPLEAAAFLLFWALAGWAASVEDCGPLEDPPPAVHPGPRVIVAPVPVR